MRCEHEVSVKVISLPLCFDGIHLISSVDISLLFVYCRACQSAHLVNYRDTDESCLARTLILPCFEGAR